MFFWQVPVVEGSEVKYVECVSGASRSAGELDKCHLSLGVHKGSTRREGLPLYSHHNGAAVLGELEHVWNSPNCTQHRHAGTTSKSTQVFMDICKSHMLLYLLAIGQSGIRFASCETKSILQ